ncbi:helix-turn-helix domain-containing protein [Longispora urticae]
MAEVAFSATDLAQMRFAVSPMWEVVSSYRLLLVDTPHPVHHRWAAQVRPRLAAAGLDHAWLAELVPQTGGYRPDFLNPAPVGPTPTLHEELTAILAVPADRIRQDLDHLRHHQGARGPRLRNLHADPTRLTRVAEEIETYWDLALAPYWARIRALLDADIFHRARQLAEHGAARLFDDLHPSLTWDDQTLRLVRGERTLFRKSAGPGLLLVPSAFTGPGVHTRVRLPEAPQLAYPARALGTLWESRPVTGTAALSVVLGRSRTLLLTELDTPASTTELARRTGLSPAGVSQNLTALRDAGLVSAHRAGRSVLYARTAAAESLLIAASP